jgi:hypothetical protein
MTDFKDWLELEGIETADDMLSVYRPVKNNETGWQYALGPAKGSSGNVILTGGCNDLVLTPKSRDAFIKYMDSKFETGVEEEAAFEHAMARDD